MRGLDKISIRVITIALLMMVSMGALADQTIVIKKQGDHGTVTASSGGFEISLTDGEEGLKGTVPGVGQTVTLTVNAATGYRTVSVVAQKTVYLDNSSPTRAGDVPSGPVAVTTKSDAEYELTMPDDEDYDVYVTVVFQADGTVYQPDGIYYLSHTNKGWYLWPSVVQSTGTTNEYLTTFNATDAPAVAGKYDAHDDAYCHWVLKNLNDGLGAFQLINPKLNKYIVRRGFPKTNTQNNNAYGDRDIWLMENPTGDDLTRSYFYLHKDDKSSPYRITFDKSQNYTFNSATGDKADLSADNDMSDRRNGLIQLYAGSPKWAFTENLLPAPTINYNSEANTFTITYDKIAAGFDILYTTDGSTPTVGGSTTQTYSSTVTVTGTYTLKSVVARYGIVLTRVASQGVGIPSDPVISSIADCSNIVEINGDGTIYYTTDGTDPDNTCTPYAEPFAMNENATIKAIAYNGTLHSDITTLNYTPQYTAKPVISQSGITITITGRGTIYYTIDGTDPTTGSTQYTAPITLSDGSGMMTIKAVAKEGTKDMSCIAETTISLSYFINDLSKLQGISSHLADRCVVTDDIDAGSLDASISGFTGEFDGGYHTISGLAVPLFDNLSGGTVKNVMFDDVNISGSGNVGAICNEATGTTKIYNCGVLSGSVSGGTNVGGLVGLIKSGSNVRVVNCYNYADVSGSDCAAGIVGKNEGTVDGATTLTGTGVRIAMCMMYGSVSGATNISPVYTGNHVDNVSKFTEYNYYLYSNERDASGSIVVKVPYTAYNDQQAIAKEEYLTRFPFYRHILNTHRELASYFLFSDYAHVDEIGHWAIKPGRDYPIVEQWEKDTKRTTIGIKDNLPNTTNDYAGKLLTGMGTGGYLTVNVSINGSSFTSQLPITDMDTLRYDYTYGKVVLPFANEYSGWTRDYDYICTGWKITSAGGANSFSAPNHDHADRSNKQKDIYDESANPYVFAQGGYYIVPDGVTSINIEANFAKAYYLSDEYYDIGYGNSYNGTVAGLGGSVPLTYHGKSVYTNLSTLLSAMVESKNPNRQAIALVGNFHYNVAALNGVIFNNHTNKALTIMSVDEDNNQEPDYGWYTYMNDVSRPHVPAIRFDFVPNIGIGMAAHVKGSSYYPNISIWKAHGWFELTETALSLMNQCEIDSRNFPEQSADGNTNRWIVNSGYFTQIVRSYDNPCDRLRYIQIGGNAYVKEFYPGNHSNKSHTNPIVPVNVTGGEIEECCMTGYHVGGKAKGDNIYFWCAGGKIHKFLGAYMETPINSSEKQENVNMTAKVNHALISKFFGGGTSPTARITGNISVTINNSKVDFYCGGPEFGDMATGKTVTTSATNTVFNNYYGAGFGGTSLTYVYQNENSGYAMGAEVEYDRSFTNYTGNGNRLNYNANYGIGTSYKFEFIPNSVGQKLVARIYLGRSQFSLASTGSVENTLNNCTVEEDFYGAGCQGTVNGNVVSNLTDCIIKGNAFGGGFKAESNKLPVYPTTKPTYSKYYGETGIFSEFGVVEPEEWEWVQGTSTDKNKAVEAEKKLYTDVVSKINMADLGNVTGDISITINGGSVGTSVYGGGNESKSLSNASVTITGDTVVQGSVFGGGNKADVEGSTKVNISNE
ncbi:MAG: chitobiase/beta-hexosaminidase C-terminal domain-containing protein [Prevotella sp.]|nr:chitobiase/beta-hexosaminidase C-terminal domain-containing protein [Prevotella sp.]